MSLGFGKVPVGEWDKVKSGSREDQVASGDYFAKFVKVGHFEPERSKKGIGSLNCEFILTDKNPAHDTHKKRVIYRGNYHPAPETVTDKDYAQMNAITETNLAQLIEAANATPELDGNGAFDLVATIEKVAKSEPEVLLQVSHRQGNDGRTMQDVGNFRPVTG